MIIFLNNPDVDGATGTRVDSFSIEATLPELQSLASFFRKCAEEVEEKMGEDSFYLEGDLPDYEMKVPEIVVSEDS